MHSPTELTFVGLAGLVAGLARGFSGFGGALIFVPMASAIMGPKIASALLLVIDGTMSLGMLPEGWKRANRREVFTMVIGALVGIPLGTAVLAFVPSVPLRWIISIVVLCLLAFLISGWRYRHRPKPHLTISVGGLSGLFGGAAQMSGPPIVAYWLGGGDRPLTVRANLVLFLGISSAVSAVVYAIGGLLTAQVLLISLFVGPCYGIGVLIGSKMFTVANETAFRHICFMLIAISALVGLPLFDGLRP
ncbi:sulfite exporter TauE/SafE family protein [Borborobacter arsenicus]|uniref:sulfite exporter TauE/SafE family protein n=1 Tax=Borborobacter arsenicus TaxID=1851146 RepID=UPI001FDF01F2|nr:sulfite exporter TauE/SafE family protein [Pseudaminobacter arsenicus]